jgi:hypothetical protein
VGSARVEKNIVLITTQLSGVNSVLYSYCYPIHVSTLFLGQLQAVKKDKVVPVLN